MADDRYDQTGCDPAAWLVEVGFVEGAAGLSTTVALTMQVFQKIGCYSSVRQGCEGYSVGMSKRLR